MEYRKLISFGNSSFVISLPKSWIRSHDLIKGTLIAVKERDGNLLLQPKSEADEQQTTSQIEICVDGKNGSSLEREITSAYINNFQVITLVGRDISKKHDVIQKILHNLVALEVMEQDTKKIIAKDFLNMNEISLLNLVNKMDSIVRSMIEDASNTFNDDVYENIFERDKDVNRLFYLVCRAIKHGLRHPSIADQNYKVGSSEKLLNLWLLVTNMEHVADAAKRASRRMHGAKLNDRQKEELVNLFKQAQKKYVCMMDAWYAKDKVKAHKLSDFKDSLMKACNDFYSKNQSESVAFFMDPLRHMISHTHDIGKSIYQ